MAKKIELSWDEKIEKAKEALKTSFWGDFLCGGLVVSGIFIFIESLELPSFVNGTIGISLFVFPIFLLFSWFIYLRMKTYRAEMEFKKSSNYINSGKYEKSLGLLNRLLEDKRNLKIKEIWNNKASTLYLLARYEESLESINYALEIDPFYKSALLGKGLLLYYLARFEEALESFDKVLAINPTHEGAWNSRGVTLRHLTRYEEALESFNKALAIDQIFKEAWMNRGLTLHDLERYEEALESFNKALTIDQNYDEAWYNKARTESMQNNKDRALESLTKAVNLNNTYREYAKVAKDFDNIRDSQEFKDLTLS